MTSIDSRDRKLDQMLASLKNVAPDEIQIQQWQAALSAESRKVSHFTPRPRILWISQLIAAALFGVVIGATTFRTSQSSTPNTYPTKISQDDAT